MPDVGGRLSHYRVLRKIGQGGMGEVYLAEDTVLERQVAIKFLPADVRTDQVARERFLREARAVATLNHPHVCVIHETSEAEGAPFIVMEYIEGSSLRERLARGPVPLAEALRLAAEIADGLDAAHARRIVHRDLKPANVMLTATGHAKVTDFGPGAAGHGVGRGGDGGGDGGAVDAAGDHPRHAGVHVARAGAGPACRSSLRHLLVRDAVLRTVRGRASFQEGRRPVHGGGDPDRRASTAGAQGTGRPAAPRGPDRQDAGQGPLAPHPVHARDPRCTPGHPAGGVAAAGSGGVRRRPEARTRAADAPRHRGGRGDRPGARRARHLVRAPPGADTMGARSGAAGD